MPPQYRENAVDSVSLHTNDDENSRREYLRSLLRPWALLVFVGVAATVQTALSYPRNSLSSEEDSLSWFHANGSSNLSSLPRFLQRHLDFTEEHKPLLPLDRNDYIGFSCAVIGLMVAAGGGIGGGGILVPIYILVMGFSPKHAIPLSNITVFGGSIANSILNVRKRHIFGAVIISHFLLSLSSIPQSLK